MCLQETLKALEHYKEDRVLFPTVLETSDFLWFQTLGVKKKNQDHHIGLMLLRKWIMKRGSMSWSPSGRCSRLNNIRRYMMLLGGHVGSYTTLWEFLKHYDMDLNKSLDIMIEHTST